MIINKRLFTVICAAISIGFTFNLNAQDIGSVINRFDATANEEIPTSVTENVTRYVRAINPDGTITQRPVMEAVTKDIPSNGSAGKGNGNWGSPSQYAPQNLKQVYKSQWMPKILPGWGPYGSSNFYPLHGQQDWTSTHYEIGGGDVILAVNDRRVNNKNDLQSAMNKAGEVVALTVADGKNSGVYCIALKVQNHRLPVLSTDNFLSPNNNSPLGVLVWTCFDDFNGHVYKPTCPFPLSD